jgi:hypothetical protein
MSIPYLVFARLLIPQHRVNYCHVWMPIRAIIVDEEKTTFIMTFGIFCYTEITFGLKNGGATYQTGIHIILETQIG